jgi:hypothetical protein
MTLFCKQTGIVLLLLAILLQSFSKVVIFADFYANQDYIAKNLCENRRTPIIHCYGRCQLNKRLLRDEKQDNKDPDRKETVRGIFLFADALPDMGFTLPADTATPHPAVLSDCRVIDQPSFCFHPPD